MKYHRIVVSLLIAAGAIIAVNCSEYEPVAPQVAAGGPSDIETTPNGMVLCTKLTPEAVTKVIGSKGGTIKVGPHEITIPKNALDGDVEITATIRAEPVVRVRLEPHGLKFAVPAEITMSYDHCGLASERPLRIAYVSPELDVLDEVASVPDVKNKKVTASLWHFSNYAIMAFLSDHVVAWGPGATAR